MQLNDEFRLSRVVQRALISSPARFVGEYETEGLLLSLAFDQHFDHDPHPYHRSAMVMTFTTPAEHQDGMVMPDYSPTADLMCIAMSILFGKRFDNHGLMESLGVHWLPDRSPFSQRTDHRLPFSSPVPRANLGISLNLGELHRIEPLFAGHLDPRFVGTFCAAGRFYVLSLQLAERQPELAYLALISCAEVLAVDRAWPKEHLLDPDARDILDQIRRLGPDGPALARRIENRLWQAKRSLLATLGELAQADFYEVGNPSPAWSRWQPGDLTKRLSAAYDLRSKLVHAGADIGEHLWRGMQRSEDVALGTPAMDDRKLAKILALAPTYTGLERLLRYCLLRYMERNGAVALYAPTPKRRTRPNRCLARRGRHRRGASSPQRSRRNP